jgi:multisubunit Na+/H+ antiporter MnhB subunit
MVAEMATRYTGHFVKTRTAATGLALIAFAILLPFVAMRADRSRPWQTVTLAILTLMPLMVAFRCLNFLAKLERQHDTPTPEMSFIFGLAVSLPMALSAVLLIMLNHYE